MAGSASRKRWRRRGEDDRFETENEFDALMGVKSERESDSEEGSENVYGDEEEGSIDSRDQTAGLGEGEEEKKPVMDLEELNKQYEQLRSQNHDIINNLKRHKDEDITKGQAVKNQKALWDITLEFRILLQKAFISSNKLPQEPVRSAFCDSDESVNQAYSDLISSSRKALTYMLELQEALLEKNSIIQGTNGSSKEEMLPDNSKDDGDQDWLPIQSMNCRITPFRNSSVDTWQRKTQAATGDSAIKRKLSAFNQNISEQVTTCMKDPARMISRMQLKRSTVGVFGEVTNIEPITRNYEDQNMDAGDPDLLDDSEFYQLLLKEFIESYDPTMEGLYYTLKRTQTNKKRKMVERRASKGRKIRYNVHEKIVNFMAPVKMVLPPMAEAFENLFQG